MAGREETVDDSEILEFVSGVPEPIVTTRDVADEFGFSLAGIRKRLYKLANDGYLDFKRVGQSPAWWITDEGRAYLERSD